MGEVLRTSPDRSWDPHLLLYNEYWVSFPGVKRLKSGVNHPPQSSAEVKERVEPYVCFPSGPSWPVLERYLSFTVLGAFAKLRKATVSLVMFVHPSVRMEQLDSHWTDFDEI